MHIVALRHLIVLAFTLLFAPVTLLACGSSTSSTTGTVRQPTSTSVPTAAPGQHFKIGQQVNVDNIWLMGLESAKTNMGNENIKPNAGYLFLDAIFSMKNISGKGQSVDGSQFTLSSTTGQAYQGVIFSQLGSSSAGGKLSADISFSVPNNVHSFVLTFEADSTASGHIVWDVSA